MFMQIRIKGKRNSSTMILLKILILFACIQHMVFNKLLGGNVVLTYSKEIVIVLLVFVSLLKYLKNIKLNWSSIFFVLFICCLAISSVLYSNISAFFFSFRKYFLPVLVLFILQVDGFFDNDTNRKEIIKYVIDLFVALSIWGIFQVVVLGDKFLLNLGYDQVFGHLDYTFYFNNFYFLQRNSSTFASPNIFACLLNLVVVTLISVGDKIYKKKEKMVRLVILLVSFLLTFSRANILSFAIVYLIFFLKIRKITRSKIKYLFAFIIVLVLAVVLLKFKLKIDVISEVINWISNTLSGNELSSATRTSIWDAAIQAVLAHPLGIGAGKVGINSGTNITSVGLAYYACENSFLVLALESGLFGLISYVAFYTSLIWRSFFNKKQIIELVMAISISFMFSNHILDIEVMILFYILIGSFFDRSKVFDVEEKEIINE